MMAISIFEVLQNANYNLQENGAIGLHIGKEQLKNAVEALEEGGSIHDLMNDEDEDY